MPSGSEVQRLTCRPFGETRSNQGTKGFEKHRFTGQEEDPETGLYGCALMLPEPSTM